MARFVRDEEIRDVVRGDDRRAYCEDQLALLADGWTRIRDPAVEAEYRDDPRVPDLERALREDPEDDETWLVYADHYIDHGHPRGQLIALESAPIKSIVDRAERDARAERQLRAAVEVLVPPHPGFSLTWRRGFIAAAKLYGRFDRGAAEDRLWNLLRHPSARFLRELDLEVTHVDAQDHRLLLALALHVAPPLRALRIHYETVDWVGFAPLGPLAPIGETFPLLEELALDVDETIDTRGLAIPRLQKLAIGTNALRPQTLAQLRRAPWPALEELALSFANSTCTAHDARFLVDGTLPAIAKLALFRVPFANELVELVVASPIASQLRRLDLRDSALDDDAVSRLLAARDRLAPTLRISATVTRENRDRLIDAELWPDHWW